MTTSPSTYEIRVHGHLDAHWSNWFGNVVVAHERDGSSKLTVATADQTQLYGVLAGLRDIGATLVALQGEQDGHVDENSEPTSPIKTQLRTERLTLRAASADDAKPTFAYRQLESVGEWLTELPTDFDAYRATFTDPERLAAAVVVELDGAIIGDFMLRVEDAWAQREVADQARNCQAELGWVLDPAHTGHGYASEAVRELLRYCFQDLRIRRVVANCFTDNTTSWRLMERVGMRREAHNVQDSLHRSGRWLDGYTYALLADEWAARGSL